MNNIEQFLNNYGKIYLSWATKCDKFPYMNFGDELSYYIHKKMFPHLNFAHCSFDSNKTRITGIGTILHNCYNGKILVWGTGIDESLINNNKFNAAYLNVYAVRGKITQKILQSYGVKVPNVFGDPAILLSDFVSKNTKKKYKLGIIPHCSNYYIENDSLKTDTICFQQPDNSDIKIIPTYIKENPMNILTDILDCEYILSESIHGCIVADALDIPNLFVTKEDNRDNKIISTYKTVNIEHRYSDYISVLNTEKFQILHDEKLPFNFDLIIEYIHKYYSYLDFSEQKKILKENHPLNF